MSFLRMTIEEKALKYPCIEYGHKAQQELCCDDCYHVVIKKAKAQEREEMNKRIDERMLKIRDDCEKAKDNCENCCYELIEELKSLKGYCSRCIAQTNGSNVCKCGDKE